jgi:hypothetical protein
MSEERKKFRLLRVRVYEDSQADMRRAKAATGVVSDSEVIRLALKELADRRERGAA